jgi:porin
MTCGSRLFLSLALVAMPLVAFTSETGSSNAPAGNLLLLDSMGRVVTVPTNEVPSDLRPSADIEVKHQIPEPAKGTSMPQDIQQRAREGAVGFQFLPATPPPLMPYLASQDDYGNTAIRPGALLPAFTPLEGPVQGAKYRLSEYGFRYSLQQSVTFVSMTGVKSGDHNLGYHALDFKSKWALFDAADAGTAGWISSHLQAKNSFESAGKTQSAKSNLGTVTDPTGIWSSVNGLRVPELAWQQSARRGEIVVVAGMVSQRNYMDGNAYADSGRSKFINSALINSQVLPLAQYNFGLNLQWQPADECYAMAGASMGDNGAGDAPWTDFSGENWSLPGEFGYAPRDFLSLGPGVYRVQPFAAGANGATGGGLCFDLQQQLGSDSPMGWFGRFGFGDSKVTGAAAAQAGTGFVVQAPFKHLLLQRTSNDLLGVGFVWSQSSDTKKTVYHENEYVLETVYALQLTPTIKIQPDVQMIWDPAFHKDTDHAMVFQLQLVMAW